MSKLIYHPYLLSCLLPFLGGVLYALGFPIKGFYSFFLLPIVGMTFLIYSLKIKALKGSHKDPNRIINILSFSFGYYITGYYWIPYTIKEFGNIPFPFNFLLGSAFSLIIAPQFFAFLLSINILSKLKKTRAYSIVLNESNHLVFFAFLMTVFEYYIPQQFPAHLGHPWIQLTPYLALAPIFGAPIYSFISYLIAFILSEFITSRKVHKFSLAIALLLIFLNFSGPLEKVTPENVDFKNQLRLVQTNVGNFLKVDAEGGGHQATREILLDYLELSTLPSKAPIDLVIWPETAFPNLLSSTTLKTDKGSLPWVLKQTIQQTQAELFIGGYDFNPNKKYSFESEYNSAFHFDSQGFLKNTYHKMKLIPFGESLPFGYFNQYLGPHIKNISFFAKGEQYTLFKTKNKTPFISAICYEILFSSFIKTYLNSTSEQASFLINLTNDSWYGDTSEPYQHLSLAKWRSIEFDIPIVRMTNTGITSIIFSDGTESERLNIHEKKKLDILLLSKKRHKTIFQRFGFFALFSFIFLVMLLSFLIKKKPFP